MRVTDIATVIKAAPFAADKHRQQRRKDADASPYARLVKLADKTCNLRDMATAPPADWSAQRKADYLVGQARSSPGCAAATRSWMRCSTTPGG